MVINKKITQLTYTGSNLILNSSSIKNNISTIYTVNDSGTGYLSYNPNALFNSLSTLLYGKVYLIDSNINNLPWELSACTDTI